MRSLVSPEPDPEAMNLRLLAALEKRDRGEELTECEVRMVQMFDARDSCPSSVELAAWQVRG